MYQYYLKWIGPITGVEKTVPGVVADRKAGSEVGPQDGFVIRGVDILVLVLDVADADPVALGGAGHVAVHQLIHFLVRSAHVDNRNM